MKVSAAIIGIQGQDQAQLEQSIHALGVAISRKLPHYPEMTEFAKFLRSSDPDLLFVSTVIPSQMEEVVKGTSQAAGHVQVVLVDSSAEPETLRRAMQLGVRECLTVPYSFEDVRGVIERTMTRREKVPTRGLETNSLYTFLPVRPGVGATLLATQTAFHLPSDEIHRSFLLDADLDSGTIQFLAQARSPYSIVEAMERLDQLDEDLWHQLVSQREHLDVMQAGETGLDYRPDLQRLQTVLSFIRKQYSAIVVDLPGTLNRLSIEMLQQSKAIFVVTTQEAQSLHMARRRVPQLKELGLGPQLRLVVNRYDKKNGITLDEVAGLVGIPVHASFANDYAEVQRAIIGSREVPVSAPLGKQLRAFAESLWKDPAAVPAPRKRRFLEVFALPR